MLTPHSPQSVGAPSPRLSGDLLRLQFSHEAALACTPSGVELCVPLEPLVLPDGAEPLCVPAAAPVRVGRRGRFAFARSEEVLCGAGLIAGEDVEAGARELLGEALALARSEGLRQLVRVWAVVPRIHEVVGPPPAPGARALDRYMLFCRGRHAALSAAGRDGVRACASTAVGGTGADLCLWFLSAAEAGIQRENPRQLPAWRYPATYGPRSPDFARATRAPAALGGALYVSGTASITGHESLHAGDLSAQLAELDRNLRVVMEEARPVALRAFVLHAEDAGAVRDDLEARWPGARVTCLRADMCRPELLVEVEALCTTAGEGAS